MPRIVRWLVALFVGSTVVASQADPSLDVLLNRYSANQNKARSWIVQYEFRQGHYKDDRLQATQQESGRVHFDGERVLFRSHTTYSPKQPPLPGEAEQTPLTTRDGILLWDGRQHVNYSKSEGGGPGSASINPHERAREIQYVQRINNTGFLFGYLNNSFLRLDQILGQTRRGDAHVGRDVLAGTECVTIDADTAYGRYKVWLDPSHGYALAKVTVRLDGKCRHLCLDRPLPADVQQSLGFQYSGFRQFGDMWMSTKVESTLEIIYPADRDRYDVAFQITEFTPNPEPNALGHFTVDFIPEGTNIAIFPAIQIQYTWRNGKPVPRYERGLVKCLDGVLDGIATARPGGLIQDGDSTVHDLLADWHRSTPKGPENTQVPEAGAEPIATSTIGTLEVNAPPAAPSDHDPFRRSHCGLYCVYSLLRLAGQKTDFVDLVKPEYIGSYEGSSLPDLIRATQDNGLFSVPASRLTPGFLGHSPCPVVLHVRGDFDSPKYDHYELFLGTEEGKAKILNPPLAPRLVSFGELAAQWDGIGLIVAQKPPDVEGLFASQRQRLLMIAGIAAVGIVLIHVARRVWLRVWLAEVGSRYRRWRMLMSVGQGILLGLGAVTCGLLSNFSSHGEGLLGNAEGVRSVRRAHAGAFLPTIGISEVKKLMGTDTVLVDARFSPDFEAGHLTGAISLPVDANDARFRLATRNLAKTGRVVVYAQSRSCPYAPKVASRLVDDGFTNVSVFKGGWREWTAKKGRSIATEAAATDGNPRG
jgi:rhodanese-related sulfurtransferase